MKTEDSYVALDLETTGLNPKRDRIIEIGAALVEEGTIKDTFSTFVNPRSTLPEKVTEITGITEADILSAPALEEILVNLSDFIGDRHLLGHSILFDYSFLKRAFVNAGRKFEKRGIDTLKLSRRYLPELPSKRLQDLCVHYGIPQRAHRALEDAQAAHFLYRKLKADYYEEEIFRPQPLLYKVKREARAGERQKERLLALLRKHTLSIPMEVDSMSKNEVSRLTDQILAKYGR